MGEERDVRHYFVDEAGGPELFDARGRVLIGTEGCSRFFILGVARIPHPEVVDHALTNLRAELLCDPYFQGVPSFDPTARKTALCFHAKNDLPEVRREVFKLLPTFGVKMQAIVRHKEAILAEAREKNKENPGYRYKPDDVYDECISRIFTDRLHKADENRIIFARRGKAARIRAVADAIEKAKANFEGKWRKGVDKPTLVHAAYPSEHGGLQAVDYYLWALQRLYEKGDERYFNFVRTDFRLIGDVDDKRNKPYGEYYNDKNPLESRKIKTP